MAALLLIAPADRDDVAASPLVASLRAQRGCEWRLAVVGPGPAIRDRRVFRCPAAGDVRVAEAEIIGLVDSSTRIEPGALRRLIGALDSRPDAAAIFGDEQRGTIPLLRPGWSPELVRSAVDVPRPLLIRTGVLENGLPTDVDAAGRHRMALDLVAAHRVVVHLPEIVAETTNPSADPESVSRVDEHLRACGVPARAEPGEDDRVRLVPDFGSPPTVSLVIPSAGRRHEGERLVERCIGSLASTEAVDLEILVVTGDEYDGDPDELTSLDPHPPKVIHRGPGEFSFPYAINTGAVAARGDLLLLLNDDTSARDDVWMAQLALHARDPRVGAVGATLLYPDDRVQHVGMVIDDARPLHPFVGRRLADRSVRAVAGGPRTVAAVTGACLMVERRKFLEVGGLSPDLPLSFNDVDLCFKLARNGYRTVHEPAAVLTHEEGATRESSIEAWEWDRFIRRWGEIEDPWYHPGFVRAGDPADPRRDADHVLPDLATAHSHRGAGPPRPRDTQLRPRVHHSRRSGPDPDPTTR